MVGKALVMNLEKKWFIPADMMYPRATVICTCTVLACMGTEDTTVIQSKYDRKSEQGLYLRLADVSSTGRYWKLHFMLLRVVHHSMFHKAGMQATLGTVVIAL